MRNDNFLGVIALATTTKAPQTNLNASNNNRVP